LTATSEGAPITYEDPLQGYDTSYVHTKYAKGFKITREMYEDDQYNVMKKMPKGLASATNRTVETQAATILINSFTSGTGGDGKYLCAADHPRADGGTAISNTETHAISETYLNTAYVAMVKTVDDKGQRILVRPDTLIIPPDLEATTRILLESQGRTATNYNEINPYQGKFKVQVWNYLTSTTAWWMIDSQIHQLNFFWRVKPEFAQDESFDTDVALYKVRCRFSCGWSDWRGVFGSTGTA